MLEIKYFLKPIGSCRGWGDLQSLGIIVLAATKRKVIKLPRNAWAGIGIMKRSREAGSFLISTPMIHFIISITLSQTGCRRVQPHQICDMVPSASPHRQQHLETAGYRECSRQGTLYQLDAILKFNSWTLDEMENLRAKRKDLDVEVWASSHSQPSWLRFWPPWRVLKSRHRL